MIDYDYITKMINDDRLNNVNLDYKFPTRLKSNCDIINNFLKDYKNFTKVEIVFLLKHKNKINDLHIFCKKCGNKNCFYCFNRGYSYYCSLKCAHNSKEVMNKKKQTFMKNYGVDNPNKCRKVREKVEQTSLQRCGYKCNFSSPDPKLNGRAGCKKRFGVENPFAAKEVKEQMKLKSLEKRGVENYAQSKEYKDLYKNKEWVKKKQQKQYESKRKNNSFNTSKSEDRCYELLKSKFNNTIRNYSTNNRYPFNCDFYIPSKDLFIECHFHWTHGGTPFNKDNEEHLKQLEKWRSKNKKYYNIAINVWTKRDPLKLKTFIDNKLNYKIFYKEEEFIECFKGL
jgi:hypothetical protein